MESATVNAYTAGIIDGEGSIRLSRKFIKKRNKLHFQFHITVVNTDKRIVDFLLRNYNGHTYKKLRKPPRQDAFVWEMTGYENIEKFLNKIMPFLVSKKGLAKLALKWISRRKGINKLPKEKRGYTEEDIIIYNKMKALMSNKGRVQIKSKTNK